MRYVRLCICAGYNVLLECRTDRYWLSLYEHGGEKRRLVQLSSTSFTALDMDLGRWLKAHRHELVGGILEG